jgi:hypothetical protein
MDYMNDIDNFIIRTEYLKENDLHEKGDNTARLTLFPKAKNDITEDSKNFFVTGLICLIGFIICFFLRNNIITGLMIIIGIAFCIPSIISNFIKIIKLYLSGDKYIK